jgi:serine/threonine-protein kinase
VLSELLLGRNIFRSDDRLQSRKNVLGMPIPRFTELRADIDEKLETILRKVLERDRNKRYQSATALLTDLEMYLYSDRYGPTNEKLGVYLRELFDQPEPADALLPTGPSPVV